MLRGPQVPRAEAELGTRWGIAVSRRRRGGFAGKGLSAVQASQAAVSLGPLVLGGRLEWRGVAACSPHREQPGLH